MATALLPDPVLERVTRTILEHCGPRRIVLYGSRARGDMHDESDYDVMVELDEIPSAEDLEQEVAEALFGEGVDVFVTTAAAFATERDDVGLLAYQIAREGVVIYARDGITGRLVAPARRIREPRPNRTPGSVDRWIRRAESSYRSVALELEHGGAPENVCFLAHQVAEKYIKAAIICLGVAPPRTHQLIQLLEIAPPRLNAPAVRRACATLNKLYGLSRYPPAREPTDKEAARAAAAATVVRAAAGAVIESLRAGPAT